MKKGLLILLIIVSSAKLFASYYDEDIDPKHLKRQRTYSAEKLYNMIKEVIPSDTCDVYVGLHLALFHVIDNKKPQYVFEYLNAPIEYEGGAIYL